MPNKGGILEQIGERSLLLPELINRGLEASDRLKYYLTLLQTAYSYAQSPHGQIPDLRFERQAAVVEDESLDRVVASSTMVTPTSVHIPGVRVILDRVLDDLRRMLEPVTTSVTMHGEATERATVYTRRVEDQLARTPSCTDDQLTAGAIETLTALRSNGHDSLHQLVIDLQWELHRLQGTIGIEVLDGAHVYDLPEADRQTVRAFMRGINETAALKFDHAGLETTAARDGDHLTIQNDLGATDAHVIVIHVTGLTASLIYTDVHRARARFLRELVELHDVTWTQVTDSRGFEISTGSCTAADQEGLERFLTAIGSRLVYLIDWNRARKRLTRCVRKADALMLLKWAAQNNVGHAGFVRAGDIRLIHTALDRVPTPQLRYGTRLDELLGRDGANRFLMSVLRIASTGLRRRSTPRLIDDEIEAELLMYLQRSDRSLLAAVSDHAMLVAGMIESIHGAIAQLRSHRQDGDAARMASLIRGWKSDADGIVKKARRTIDSVDHATHLRRLLAEGEHAVEVLEDAAFTLTLVPDGIDSSIAALLGDLSDLASRAVREYVRCLEDARDLSRSTIRADLERFLVTVDRLATLEDSCDEAERALRARMFRGPAKDFRELYVLSELTRQLDHATDSVVHSGLLVRDYVLSVAPGA